MARKSEIRQFYLFEALGKNSQGTKIDVLEFGTV